MIEKTEFYRILKDEVDDSSSEKASSIKKETRSSSFKVKFSTIYFNKTRKTPTSSLRIKKFRIKISSRRISLELSCHPSGIHWREQAIFYSRQGCIDCKLEMELYRKLL